MPFIVLMARRDLFVTRNLHVHYPVTHGLAALKLLLRKSLRGSLSFDADQRVTPPSQPNPANIRFWLR